MATSWTQADIDKLRAAILALATGESVQTVTYAGPPSRTITYRPVNLSEMRALLATMEQSVARGVSARPGYRLAATRKGV